MKMSNSFFSGFQFLHKNTKVNISLILVIYTMVELSALPYVLMYDVVDQPSNSQQAVLRFIMFPWNDYYNNASIYQNFTLYLQAIAFAVGPLIILYLIQQYGQRQRTSYKQIVKTSLHLLELGCVCLYMYCVNPLYLGICQYLTQILITNTYSVIIKIIHTIIAVVTLVSMLIGQILFLISYQEANLVRSYNLKLPHFFIPIKTFILFEICLSFFANGNRYVIQIPIFVFCLCYIFYMSKIKLFAYIRNQQWIYTLVIFQLLFTLQSSFLNFALPTKTELEGQGPLKTLFIILDMVVAYLLYLKQQRPCMQSLLNELKFKTGKNLKQHHDDKVLINYSITKDMCLNMAAFYGPEFVGVLNSEQKDLLSDTTPVQLSEAEIKLYITRVQKAEQQMEEFKLLYENIYSNIFYSYACVGQTLETLTLLDIEEAMPIPSILSYISTWKTPYDAFASVLNLIQEVDTIDKMLQFEGVKYQSIYDSCCTSSEVDATLFNILQRNCIDVKSLLTKINKMNNLDQRVKKGDESNAAEQALWNNNYQKPSDQKVHGMFCVLNHKDYIDNQYLFKHVGSQVDKKSVMFCYIPSFTSKSAITGNIHRLSFANDQSSMKTAQLRKVKILSLISLSRIIFPLNSLIDKKFKFPLVNQYKFTISKQQPTRITKQIKTSYLSHYEMRVVSRQKSLYNSRFLYNIAPILLNAQQFNNVNNSTLQNILVEYFIYKFSTTKTSSQRIQRYFDTYYNNKLNTFQKIQLCCDPEKIDPIKIEQSKLNVNHNMNNQIAQNAVTVIIGCGSIDNRCAKVEQIFSQLALNQHYVINDHYEPMFYGYIDYMRRKYKLIHMNIENKQLYQIIQFLEELQEYLKLIHNSCKINIQQMQRIKEVLFKFLEKYHLLMQDLISVKSKNKFETDQLQLIHLFKKQKQNQNEEDEQTYDDCLYESVQTLFTELSVNISMSKILNQYQLPKISNLSYTLEQFTVEQYYEEEHKILNPIKPNSYVSTALQGLHVINVMLTTTFHNIDHTEEQEDSIETSFVTSSKKSQESNEFAFEEKVDKITSQFIYDINMDNPRSLDDYINIISSYYSMYSDNAIFFNHELNQNTPEFLINVIKNDFIETQKKYNFSMYQFMLYLITDLHYIKLQDKTMRNTNTVCYIIPRIQTMQDNIEKMIVGFLKNLYVAKLEQNTSNNLILMNTINSISYIEQQIKKLHQARSIVLKRENLSQDHINQIAAELYRSLRVTYGLPLIQLGKNIDQRRRLLAICDTYAGTQTKYQDSILMQIESLPRCGGVYKNDPSYKLQRHSSFKDQFEWEQPHEDFIKNDQYEQLVIDKSDNLSKTTKLSVKQRFMSFMKDFKQKSLLAYIWTFIVIFILSASSLLLGKLKQASYQIEVITYGIEQSLSENLLRMNNLGQSLLLTSLKSNYTQQNNPEYLTTKYASFIRGSDKLFQSYVYLKSALTGQNTSEIYESESKSKGNFQFNLTQIMNGVDDNRIQCSFTNYDKQITQKLNSLRYSFKYNFQTFETQNNVYNDTKLQNISIVFTQKFYQLTTTFIEGKEITATLPEIMLIYVELLSCYSQKLLQLLQLQMENPDFETIISKIQDLHLSYTSIVYPSFQFAMELVHRQYVKSIMLFVCFTVILTWIVFYFAFKSISYKYVDKLIVSNIDKGSIIQMVSNLSTQKIEMLLQSYKTSLRQSKKSEGNTINHSVAENENQVVSPDVFSLLQKMHKVVLQPKLDYLIYIIMLAFIFLMGKIFLQTQIIDLASNPTIFSIENRFENVNFQPKFLIPQFQLKDFANNKYGVENLYQYYSQSVSIQHPLQQLLYYSANWIEYFSQNLLDATNLEYFKALPYSSILQLYNFINTCTQIDTDIKKQIILHIQSLYTKSNQMISQIINIDNGQLIQSSFMFDVQFFNNHLSTDISNWKLEDAVVYLNKHMMQIKYDFIQWFLLYLFYLIVTFVLSLFLICWIVKYIFQVHNNQWDENSAILSKISIQIWKPFYYLCVIFLIINLVLIINNITHLSIFYYNRQQNRSLFISLQNYYNPILSFMILILSSILVTCYQHTTLNVLSSLGVPSTPQKMFSMPYYLRQQKQSVRLVFLQILSFVYVAVASLVIIINLGNPPSRLGTDLSQAVSALNHQGGSLLQKIAMTGRTHANYDDHFTQKVQLLSKILRDTWPNREINLKAYVNVSSDFVINQLVDARWKSSLSPFQNLATLSYELANPPSIVYGNCNFSVFQQLKPPRTMKLGPHLFENDDQLSKVTIKGAFSQLIALQALVKGPDVPRDIVKQLSPDGTAASFYETASRQLNIGASYLRLITTDLPLLYDIMNNEAYQLLFDQTSELGTTQNAAIIIGLVLNIVLFLAFVILNANVKGFIKERLQRNNQFVSLFLKRIMGVKRLE
ncbi:Transmembrane_domain-containing protein [Hexamita inflata]|uniref:Transmembrane domain-containing protein n=1 Tax=Hexamita inflata TaxID=28002 RepID=A0AA86NIZ1_9EUKA|nr:Transmembrane domain-containing protein [Hexamita inflata]